MILVTIIDSSKGSVTVFKGLNEYYLTVARKNGEICYGYLVTDPKCLERIEEIFKMLDNKQKAAEVLQSVIEENQ